MNSLMPSLSIDELPLSAHRLLCVLGNRADIIISTLKDYSSRYRAYVGHLRHIKPGDDLDTLVCHVTPDTLHSYADDLCRRVGPRQARLDLIKLSVALRAILPPDTILPDFRIEYRRLRQLPEPSRRAFRYGLAISEVPIALRGLFADIEIAKRLVDSGKPLFIPDLIEPSTNTVVAIQPLKSRQALRRVLLRFLGSLVEAKVDIEALTPDTLVTTEHLDIYIARATDTGSARLVASCLYCLRSSLRSVNISEPVAEVLARYGIAEAEFNKDYETFVPTDDRLLLERALARSADDRLQGEPGSLTAPVATKVKRSIGAFRRASAGDPDLADKPAHLLDLAKALYRYEATMKEQETTTLIIRLVEIKAALQRIAFERENHA